MKTKALAFLLSIVSAATGQIHPDWIHSYGDSIASAAVHDFTVDTDGAVYSAGQILVDGKRIFVVTGHTQGKDSVFTVGMEGPFEEKGLHIAVIDALHLSAAGFFEDSTGTFNVRTMKIAKTGEVVWNREFGNDGLSIMDIPQDLECDPFGNIIIAGNSHSIEGQYSIVHYSPSGQENWSLRHTPVDTGWSAIKDIVIDAAGNIYGITSNTFVNDTTHGTIFKRDTNGGLLWERTFDLMFPEEAHDLLVLRNDTLYAAGSLVTEGGINSSIVCVAVTSSGDVAAYRKFDLPGAPAQQAVRSFSSVFGNRLVLVNESFHSGAHLLHTFVMTESFSVEFTDSSAFGTPVLSQVANLNDTEFAVVAAGSAMYRTVYRRNMENIDVADKQQFLAPPKSFSKLLLSGEHIYLGYIAFDSPSTTSTILRFTPHIVNTAGHAARHASDWNTFPAFPNPFNSSTSISYMLPDGGLVSVSLYDINGRMIRRVFLGYRNPGFYAHTIDAAELATGTYFVRMIYQGKSSLQKILYVK